MKIRDIISLFRKNNVDNAYENVNKKSGISEIKIQEKIIGNRENGYIERYQNGKLISKTPYSDGKIDGRVYTYYEDGSIESVQNYKNGKLHGISTIYDRYGNVTYDSEYENGDLVGKSNFESSYDRDCEWHDRDF